ncbi:pentatricopeptide repeat-containing protein At4g30825, chloroplastic [Phalaenopsis equestris]|uniref:pentatricopeptide repeat-containing protein At4g30825, chloroplastic n=1 Tax=Phalaenopsis equestris TaxID=78828 RepID=UPI0009E48248|nr:pentatricopeptide repeat-containing protein At4g30825, chloroplastic [Phalaenopsis equestris]
MRDWGGSSLCVPHFGVGFTSRSGKGAYQYTIRCQGSCSIQTLKQFAKKFSFRVAFLPSTCLNWCNLNPGNNRSDKILIHALEGDDIFNLKSESEDESQANLEDNAALVNWGSSPNSPVSVLAELRTWREKSTAGKKSKRKIWNRVHLMNKVAQIKISKQFSVNKVRSSKYIRNNGGFESVLSTITPQSSTKQCNLILKLLERRNEEKAIHFFEWMKSNGKLNNASAYKLALRVLARREDWVGANLLLQEMAMTSDFELDSETFNQLIYTCAKRQIDAWGARWFRLMLQSGVQPTVSTIGMLMNLYQKTTNLSEAEFTFSYMRSCNLQCVSAYSSMVTIYTHLGMHEKSEEIIYQMDEDGVSPNFENWLVRLNAYCQKGKLNEAESVLNSMKVAGFTPNIVAYNTLITGYGRVSNTKAAEKTFQCLKGAGLEPDETTYRSMIEGFGRNNDYKRALWYYEQLKGTGFQPNSSNFHTMVNIQARHNDEKGIIQTVKDMKLAGCQYSSILSSLVQAYKRAGRIESIPSILQNSFYEEILFDPTACSILVVAYVQKSLLVEALQVLNDKKWEDYKFEENLYHLLICSFKEENQYENAHKTFHQMPKLEKHPNLQITCTMIGIYCAMNKFSEAENLYLVLKASEISFDLIAYSVVVRMYMKSGSLREACLVLDAMEKQSDIVPDTFLFRDMLRIYQQCDMHEKLANTYYWILRSRVSWDEAMYNCVLNCCGRALPIDEVSRLFDEMIQSGYTCNTITFNAVLNIYGKAGLLKKVKKIFLMARKRGVADVITYNTIIAVYGRSKVFKKMESVVRGMENSGFPVSLEAYNCMLDAYGKEDLIEEFKDVQRKMERASCSSDHYTYNIMMNIYGKKGWIEDVSQVLEELKRRGLEPDLYSYNTLIKAYGVAGMVEEAVNVVQEMRAKGVEPDRVTYTNIIVALQRNENFLEAIKWSLWMKQMGM